MTVLQREELGEASRPRLQGGEANHAFRKSGAQRGIERAALSTEDAHQSPWPVEPQENVRGSVAVEVRDDRQQAVPILEDALRAIGERWK